ncbi:hypothetical protein F5148DRAFT_1170984 [Russula earlei]|uniref:Uncharacterized protein n=1 Tax=Russula earlei TaxID=71964 RepID=A0ACC0UJ26_9AGAM|nr:hypothetical protein F5148DRAFT_1170984 [Russula earlei]
MTLPPPLLPRFLLRATCVSLCFSPSFSLFFTSQAAVATTIHHEFSRVQSFSHVDRVRFSSLFFAGSHPISPPFPPSYR